MRRAGSYAAWRKCWPGCRAANRVYEAHSFSGRGVMQSYGVGQALADLIASGRYDQLDASALSRARFEGGEPAFEALHI